jgi:general stress protein YciG
MATNQNRGFAGMDPDRQRKIASEGGRASHESGNAHEWDSREASEAGRLGGRAAHHHGSAAFHHDTAAHHHRQAAGHRRQARHDEAELHSSAARGHEEDAQYHAGEARRHGRGFAGMDPDRQREIASEGGRASHGGRGRDDEQYESQGSQNRPRSDRGEFESSSRMSGRSRDDRDDERGRNGSNQPRDDRGEFEARR